jgi:hypothetical protein
VRLPILKIAILSKYPSQRAFLAELRKGAPPLILTEDRLSRLITGSCAPRPEEASAPRN